MTDLKLDAKKCVLVCVDMQDKVIDITWDRDIIRSRAAAFTSIVMALDAPVIKLEHVPSKMGSTTAPLEDILKDVAPVRKSSFSAMGAESFPELLALLGKEQVIVFGVEAHVCVCQTVLDLIEAAYDVFVVADACSSSTPYHRDIAYDRMRHAGAVVGTAQSFAFELIGRADHPKFKALLSAIKEL